eukprot:s2004_g8.t1
MTSRKSHALEDRLGSGSRAAAVCAMEVRRRRSWADITEGDAEGDLTEVLVQAERNDDQDGHSTQELPEAPALEVPTAVRKTGRNCGICKHTLCCDFRNCSREAHRSERLCHAELQG